MNLTYWNIEDASPLAEFYNRQIAEVPYCYPVSSEEFGSGIRWEQNETSPCENLLAEALIVGEQDGQIVGFAHVGVPDIQGEGQSKQQGAIRFLVYQPGYRAVGQVLLAESEKYLRERGVSRVLAFHYRFGYRFYHQSLGYLIDRLGHVLGLMGMNGYEVKDAKIFLELRNFHASEPALPDHQAEIVVHRQPKGGKLPGLIVRMYQGGRLSGICESTSIGHYQRAEEAQDQFFVWWIGVEEEAQGQGWGRYLLQRTHYEMQKIGYRHALLGTNLNNHRALMFYTNMGYRVVNTSYELIKNL